MSLPRSLASFLPARLRGATLLALLVLATQLNAAPFTLSRVPTPADRTTLQNLGWSTAARDLETALAQAYSPASANNAAFQQWTILWEWCRLLAAKHGDTSRAAIEPAATDDPAPSPAPDADPLAALANLSEPTTPTAPPPSAPPATAPSTEEAALLADVELGRLLAHTLRPEDKPAAVLDGLAEILRAHPAKFAEYRKLAVALAVTFDQPPGPRWPHHQVPADKVPRETAKASLADRFAFWTEANSTGKLVNDLRRLDVDQLKFVVDTPLAWDELRWAQKNLRVGRQDSVRLYSSIRYDRPRLDRNEFSWNHPDPYTFASIQKLGGICVDQAHFAAQACKARGIPALFFTGEGVRGGHAWVGIMLSNDKWDMDCGRYAYDNYATGSASDPQTRKPITDHELELLAKRFRDTPEYLTSVFHLRFASILRAAGDPKRERTAIQSAISICPANPDAWAAQTAWLKKNGGTPAELKTHFENALRQFNTVRELRARYARLLADTLTELGDTEGAKRILASEITRNRGDRTDLSAIAAGEQVMSLIEAAKYNEVLPVFRRVVGKFGTSAPNDIFREVVKPAVTKLHGAGQTDLAKKCWDIAKKEIKIASLNNDLGAALDALGQSIGAKTR
jgi:hypothetical protein